MICRWCLEPVETVEVTHRPGVFRVQDCIRPACVQARQRDLDRRRCALSRQRPPDSVMSCLPGMHEPYGFTPIGAHRRCRHCDTMIPREEKG